MHSLASRLALSALQGLATLGCGLWLAGAALAGPRQGHDPVVLTFATVGDSRQDPGGTDASQWPLTRQDYTWLQNSKAWSRLMREIQARGAHLLLFNGDMIMGYGDALPAGVRTDSTAAVLGSDLVRYHLQASFWRGMVAPLIEAGTYVLPVPGNHEVQCKSGTTTTPAGLAPHIPEARTWAQVQCTDLDGQITPGKYATAANEAAWRDAFGDLIVDADRMNLALPRGMRVAALSATAPGQDDGLRTDQRQLSHSFDVGDTHFAIVNTDPAGADSSAPTRWLSQDFADARARGARRFFVFGHKPAYTYAHAPGTAPVGLDARRDAQGRTANRDAFWRLIEAHDATYFCGHEHIFHMSRPQVQDADGRVRTSRSWQVIVGSGGSPFEARSLHPGQPATDRHYAFARVSVRRSGAARIDVWGFDEHHGPTRRLATVMLPPPSLRP